ncbi:MAG TPA: hypothetical protein VES65_03770 [Solirubrobacteraceae bacterium]|nr:hypothetical protein [Solirubrobacteraceae bacterium]
MNENRLTPSRKSAARWRALPAVAAVTIAAWTGAAASAAPVAHSARSCSVPKYPGLGYFTSLSVTNTDCATGRKLVVAYYHCRTRSGRAGSCHSTVLGFTCHERRQSIPTEIDARVTCRRHNQTVIHTYQQDT